MYEAMLQNKEARNKIREIMNATIEQPRETVSPHAPRIEIMRINPDKIGALIGPGGKNIRAICEESGAQVDIDDDGTVHIFASNTESMNIAKERVEGLTAEAEVGKIYRGLVKSVKEFGAFVEILPGQEGLLHISEMADYRVDKVEDICNVGDFVSVKVVEIDPARGRIRLSRKEAMADME
jgi:polyribonucleotide nucleotidyltransferase